MFFAKNTALPSPSTSKRTGAPAGSRTPMIYKFPSGAAARTTSLRCHDEPL
jgi:hypothetical protein